MTLNNFSARYTGVFVPQKTESVTFRVSGDDGYRLIVNGDTLANLWKGKQRVMTKECNVNVKEGQKYNIQLDYVQIDGSAVIQFDVLRKIQLTNADILAKVGDADAVIYVGGISPKLEGEEMKVDLPGFKGGDRTDIELPEVQRQMIAMLHQAGKRVVYINCSGSAMGLEPETHHADAILQAWYAGEQGGTAVADVLFGDYNPSGKLPITFYKDVKQLPDYEDYRMTGRTYRYFKGEALYPFGYGLSYTDFVISKPKYDIKKGKVTVSISNKGNRDGYETVQVYIKNVADKDGPLKTLRGYSKVGLKSKETKDITIDLPRKCFEMWDVKSNTMKVVPGSYQIMVGSSSDNKDLKIITVDI